MGVGSLLIAVQLAMVAQAELVVLPPAPDGVAEKEAIDAWRAVARELKKQRAKLGLSMALHDEIQTAILGPGRQKAWACGGQARCLADLGGDLGAALLVSGTIDKDGVTLVLLEVSGAKKLTGARSSQKLAGKPIASQAAAAAKGLAASYAKSPARKKSAPVAKAPPKGKGKGKEKAPPPEDAPPEDAGELPEAPTAPPEEQPTGINGMIRIAAAQLEGVVSVTVDGGELVQRADKSMIWMGAPGSHSLVARKADGARYSTEVLVNPRQIIEFTIGPWEVAAPVFVPPSFEEVEASRSPLEKWWFWVSVGAVVVAGSVTSLALLGGDKGGPDITGQFGAISGTY